MRAIVVEHRVPSSDAEVAAASLWTLGATAIEWREDGPVTTLVAGFPTSSAAQAVAAEIGARAVAIAEEPERWRDLAEPVEAGTVVVVPAWRPVTVGCARRPVARGDRDPVTAGGARLVLHIDPGACFGSGSHASTRLLLGLLGNTSMLGRRVVDVGTGSGILAVAAARLGAVAVTAVDCDPAAVAVTVANAERNAVGPLIDVSTTSVENLRGPFDLALVNVTAGVHAAVGASVAALVRPGGRLMLAGLLPGQWRHVVSAYAGCSVVQRPHLDGWEAAVLRRTPPASESHL